LLKAIPVVSEQNTSYENFEARCPLCQHWNIFNRASDLKTYAPIGGLEVSCHGCYKQIWITGDRINPAFEMLLFDARAFWNARRYMQCILTSVQACEVFMAAVVNTRLLYRPFPNQRSLTLFNDLSLLLYERTRRHTFVAMRDLLLRIVLDGLAPQDLDEARLIITSLPQRPPEVPRAEILAKASGRLQEDLLRLANSTCNEQRNHVIHKHAYRPTATQAESVMLEAEDIVFSLKHDLGPDLEFEDYANAPPGRNQ